MAFGKKQSTVREMIERTTDAKTREGWNLVSEWTGPEAIATAELSEHVRELVRR
jgi:hypothetical protein